MLEEADRLSVLVDTMLTLARADTGQSPPALAEVDLGALVRSVVEMLQVLAEEKGQHVEIAAPSTAIIGSLDKPTARRAIVNIVDNAIRYTPEGGTIRAILRRPSSDRAFIDIVDEVGRYRNRNARPSSSVSIDPRKADRAWASGSASRSLDGRSSSTGAEWPSSITKDRAIAAGSGSPVK